jgi:ABC-type glycerol-3-phosphate transport system permease component
VNAIAGSRRATWLLYAGLTVLSVAWLVPVFTALMISVLPLQRTQHGWWTFRLSELTLRNYATAWQQGLSGYTVNSLVISLLAVSLTVGLGTVASFAFACLSFRFRRVSYFLLVTTMIVPVQIILFPLLPWFRVLHLNDGAWQFLGIALVHTAFGAGWAVFMLGAFFSQIPSELMEAARIDGAGTWGVFRRVALPLAIPGIASFAIIDFVFVWNDLLLGLTLLDADHRPLTVGLANLQAPHLNQDDLISAGSIMAILPPLILFALLNRVYVRGLFAGSVKG